MVEIGGGGGRDEQDEYGDQTQSFHFAPVILSLFQNAHWRRLKCCFTPLNFNLFLLYK